MATSSFVRFDGYKMQRVMSVLVVVLMIVGTMLALILHLPTDAGEQGISSGPQAVLMNGTAISPPTIMLVVFVIFTGLLFLASRIRRTGLVGVIGVSVLSLVALLATISDDRWRELLSTAHFDWMMSPLALFSFLVLLCTALFGILTFVQIIRWHSREAHRQVQTRS